MAGINRSQWSWIQMRFSFINSFILWTVWEYKGKKLGRKNHQHFLFTRKCLLKIFHFANFIEYEDLVFFLCPYLLSSLLITSLLPCYWAFLPFLPVFLWKLCDFSVSSDGQLNYRLLRVHIYWLSTPNHLPLTVQHQALSILQMLPSFQEQTILLVSLGTDAHSRSRELETHPINHINQQLQARGGGRLSHEQRDFLKDCAPKKEFKIWVRAVTLAFVERRAVKKGRRAIFSGWTTSPFSSHTSQSLLEDLRVVTAVCPCSVFSPTLF